ncbi:DNA primase [Halanaerobium saccharolyticum]|uniref:DNA primase n=1 Tax=Halanaerobium saccharolyticum TaxID=43595 RepID=A0A4R7Z4U8_9FIRM|nr:DNA primase [Halanaerobium saccharolyticum]TDW05303.1 DNA primase [Halanaerobium saccharolyticum]TDX60373.1 DNA primase [Halanaerobium saccharolyticum]
MARYSDDFINEVKENVDIVDLVSDYLELEKTGNRYKGLCPFHSEKTPSFFVNPDNNFYHCFGCGAGGDTINFVMEIENLTFVESLKMLAERTGMELPDMSNQQRQQYKVREQLFSLNNLAARFYNYLLTETEMGKAAYNYLEERGFNEADIEEFNLGFAADEWQLLLNFLQKKGFSIDLIKKAGLISEGKNNSHYDKFRNRVIFPIFNNRGEVIAFGGRILESEDKYGPKYLNSPETPIFSKKKNLYGLHLAKDSIREQNSCIIMEGYTDVIQAHKNGFKNSIASLGTAFTEEQAKLIKRYAENAYIAYDADTAGNKATLRGLDILSRTGINVKVIQLQEGSDPDQLLKDEGEEAFNNLIEDAVNLIDFKINMIIKNKNLSEPGVRKKVLRSIVELLSEVEDNLEREIYIERAAAKTKFKADVLAEEVEKEFRQIKSRNYQRNREKQNKQSEKEFDLYSQLSYYQKVEEEILAHYISNPALREELAARLSKNDFNGRTAQLAGHLFKGSVISNSVQLDKVKDNLGDELLSYWSEILVKQDNFLSRDHILELADYLSSKRISRNKKKLCSLLSRKELSLDKLNRILLTFYSLNYNIERRD